MVKRLDQQFRVTRIMMESFHLYGDVESSRLRSYMMGYFTMMMAICSVLTKLSDEDCADERLKTLWNDRRPMTSACIVVHATVCWLLHQPARPCRNKATLGLPSCLKDLQIQLVHKRSGNGDPGP